jgi:hypothetical protein
LVELEDRGDLGDSEEFVFGHGVTLSLQLVGDRDRT